MLPKYETAHIAFGNMADKDAQRNFTTVRKYSYEQKEAYRDVNFANAVNFRSENAQHYYNDISAVKGQLDDINKLLVANYGANYGAEWCKAKYDAYEADIVKKTVDTALANGDTEAAKRLLSAFGDKVEPSILNATRKSIIEADKQDYILSTAERIAKDIGYDGNKVESAIAGLDSYEVDDGGSYYKAKPYISGMIGTPYKWGGNGKDGIDCSGFTQQAAREMGHEVPRTADAQCRYAEQNGLFVAHDGKYVPQAGDLVFIVGTDKRFKATDNWQESRDPSKMLAYRGVTHIGMVTENGTLVHSGSSKGVCEVPLSTFAGKILGYGQLGSGKRKVKMTAKDKEALEVKVRSEIARHKNDERERVNSIINSVDDEMFQLRESGETDPKAYMAVAKRHAGDPEVYKKAVAMAEDYGKSGKKSSGLSKDEEAYIKDMIDLGKVDEGMLRELMTREGISYAEQREVIKYYKENQDKRYDWEAMQQNFFEVCQTKDKGLWFGAKEAGKEYIEEYRRTHNNEYPSFYQVQEAVNAAGAKPKSSFFRSNRGLAGYERLGLSNAEMRLWRWSETDENKDGTVTITFPNGATITVTKEEFDKKVKTLRDGQVNK
jgi:hypothetical protein